MSVADWASHYTPNYFDLAPSSFHVWLSSELDTLHSRRGTRKNVIAPRGSAKALALDTPIPTPHGWKTMEMIGVGDYVFDETGEPCAVEASSPVFYGHECYRVTFDDGHSVVADAGHLWRVTDRFSDRDGLILHTEDLVGRVVTTDRRGWEERRFRIGLTQPVQYASKTLPIHPYVLGYWLGDGTSDAASLTTHADDWEWLVAKFAACGESLSLRLTKGKSIRGHIGIVTRRPSERDDTFRRRLNALDVLNNKHVPADYLQSSVEQRRDLLQGLMDSDGTTSSRASRRGGHKQKGACAIVSKFSALADGIMELLVGLGMKPNRHPTMSECNGKVCGPYDRIGFAACSADQPFAMPRKLQHLPNRSRTISGGRQIVSVERVASVPTKCIQVDSPNHLYLCGRGMIPTHNSTWSTFVYPLYCACHGLEPYIILSSDTGNQAEKFLDAIRSEFEGNELIKQDYPHLAGPGPIWRYDRIRLANGVMIEAVGTGTKLRGRRNRQHRPSLIIADDPQNTGHIISQLQRERSWEWMTKDVANAGNRDTNIITLGTALHRDCIVLKLQRTPGWQSHLFKSIVEWPTRMDLWQEWQDVLSNWEDTDREVRAKEFYERHRAEMDAGAVTLWPARESLYDLMSLRASIGNGAFGSEKQGSPINPEACEWAEDLFNGEGFWFESWPTTLQCKTLSLDPSKGKDARRGDYSAYVRLGLGSDNIYYLEADLQRRDTSTMVLDGVEHVRAFRPDGFAVETNQFQELLAPDFIEAGAKQGIDLPIYPIENTVNKNVRIRRLGPLLSQRRIRFKARSPGTAILVQQLRDFPVGDHDDGCDSAEQGLRLMQRLMAPAEDDDEGSYTLLQA